jgi:hypothetical protein
MIGMQKDVKPTHPATQRRAIPCRRCLPAGFVLHTRFAMPNTLLTTGPMTNRASGSVCGVARGRGFPTWAPQRAACYALALMLMTPALATAQTTATASGDGLSVAVDWWNLMNAGGGYCPVRVQISNSMARPRPLKIVLETRVMSQAASEVTQSLELPASGKADFIVSLPITQPYESWTLRIYDRGSELKKVRLFGIGGTTWWGQNVVPMIALITSTSPDLRHLSSAVTEITAGKNQPGGSTYAPMLLKPGEAPTKWIDYTMLDMAIISIRELDQMPAAAREALASWVLAGGNLFVYGLSEDRENDPQLRRLLDLDRRAPRGVAWQVPRVEDRNAEFVGLGPMSIVNPGGAKVVVTKRGRQSKTGTVAPGTASEAAETDDGLQRNDTSFSIRPFGLGQLIASSKVDPFPGTLEEWGWVIKTFKLNRVQWQDRHGVSPRFENDDFWSFLIPGVGRAPVGGFQILITLFAVLIGPVNYFLLRRRGQLYLLVATVPLIAGSTALLLLGYAVVSDGFALRGRVRSVTLLDQVRSESVSWSRISYYAGVAPSGGLRFSKDTAVYPIRPPGTNPSSRTVDWTDGQHMPVGWLRSRTPTQLLTVNWRQTVENLAISTSTTGSARVTNNLGANVRWMAVADESGQIFEGENIATDASERLVSQTIAECYQKLREFVDDQPLETPAEITRRTSGGFFFGPRFRYWGNRSESQWASSRCEEVFELLKSKGTPALQAILQPRTYIAVTELPPTADLGVTSMRDAGSLYVVIGSY